MRTIEYKWSREIKGGAFWISEQNYEEQIKNIAPYNWEIDAHNEYDDAPGYTIQLCRNADKPFAQIVVEEITKLIQQGFTLTDKAQDQFEYWGKKYAEMFSYKPTPKEQPEKEAQQVKYDYKLWCDKYGCETNQKYCDRCERGNRMGCRPALMKVRMV